jgi:uncharacterized membrane protein YhaH (DUF805 family)
MKLRPSDLWTLKGTIERTPYVLWAGALVLLKYNVDRVLYRFVLGERWDPLNYHVPGVHFGRLTDAEPSELWPFMAVALPFAWVGVVLTLRRLRSIGQSPWLVLLFFLPVLNLLLFALLATIPPRPEPIESTRKAGETSGWGDPPDDDSRHWVPRRTGRFAAFVPASQAGAALCGFVYAVPLTAVLVWFSASALGTYGWGVFFGLPFVLGLVSVLIYGYHEPRTFGKCISVAMLSMCFLAVLLMGLMIEGAICILMASPICLSLGFLGGLIGYDLQLRAHRRRGAAVEVSTLASLFFAIPALVGVETAAEAPPTVYAVRTAIEIDAPPADVWNEVVAFAEIDPPKELIFRAGIAYPIRAEIEGHGVGAVRRCVFSTGAFVEPIEVWDEPRLLKFSVTEQPPAMKELMLYPGSEPPHLDDYLVSDGGQFLLEALPGGRTRLEGTTWYSHRIRPERYWKPWSDAIMHKIHMRVLEHIRDRVEA